jgi:predicted KAP-like P-loop ATPase
MYPRWAVGSRDSSPLRLWSDNPTSVDLLGFGDIAAPILEDIRRERLDPVAVEIFGDWGSGKTTILEILDEALRPVEDTIVAVEDTIVVYTRPWEHDPTLDARATLITEVLDALRTRAKKDETLWDTTKEKFAGLARRIKWSKAITLASRSAVTFTLPSVESLVEIFGDKPEVADPTLQGFRTEFAELMADFKDVSCVVVLVDDLDRCLAESVVMTLEAIKLFLSVPKMVFVVAADEALVRAAVARISMPVSREAGRPATTWRRSSRSRSRSLLSGRATPRPTSQ